MNFLELNSKNLLNGLLYLFAFLLPWQTRWIFIESQIPFQQMSLYSFDIILIILFTIIIFSKANHKPKKQSLKNKFLIPTHLSLLVFILLVTTSILWSPDKIIALYWTSRLLLAMGLTWLIPKINFNKKILIQVIIISIFLQAMLGVGQFLTQDDIISTKWLGATSHKAYTPGTSVVEIPSKIYETNHDEAGRFLRAYGTQPHPNTLGGLMIVGILLTLYLYKDKEHTSTEYKKTGLVAIYSVLLTVLVFTFSRSAWLGLSIVGFIHISYLIYKKHFTRYMVIFYLTTLLIISVPIFIYLPIVKNRLTTQPRLEQQAIQERFDGLIQAKSIINRHSILGTGVGNYTFVVQKNYPELKSYQIQPVHNIIFLITSETGYLGIIFFVLILFFTTKIYHINPRNKQRNLWLMVLVSLIITNLFDHYIWTIPSYSYLFWLTIAMLISHKQPSFEENQKETYNANTFYNSKLKP